MRQVYFKFWSRDCFREKIRFLAAIIKRNIFWLFCMLIYGLNGYKHTWCKFRTKIPTGKYSKMDGSKWTPIMHKREWKVAYVLKL